MPIREFARAKINLTLKVCGRRPDGYHELRTVFQTRPSRFAKSLIPRGGTGSSL